MRIISIVIGIGTAFIVASLVHLGIRAFYPRPPHPGEFRSVAKTYYDVTRRCPTADTACERERATQQAQQEADRARSVEENEAFNAAVKLYNRNYYYIANVIGLAVFALGFVLIFKVTGAARSAPIGIMAAGFLAILSGYAIGLYAVSPQARFVVGLVVAALLVSSSIWLARRIESAAKSR